LLGKLQRCKKLGFLDIEVAFVENLLKEFKNSLLRSTSWEWDPSKKRKNTLESDFQFTVSVAEE
jgi:hypothetical protein